jgi:hypothetical protein
MAIYVCGLFWREILGFEWRGGEWVSSLEASPSISGFLHASSCSKISIIDKSFVHANS